nr:hypothetical protein [uncultured Roseateles sp.]
MTGKWTRYAVGIGAVFTYLWFVGSVWDRFGDNSLVGGLAFIFPLGILVWIINLRHENAQAKAIIEAKNEQLARQQEMVERQGRRG